MEVRNSWRRVAPDLKSCTHALPSVCAVLHDTRQLKVKTDIATASMRTRFLESFPSVCNMDIRDSRYVCVDVGQHLSLKQLRSIYTDGQTVLVHQCSHDLPVLFLLFRN